MSKLHEMRNPTAQALNLLGDRWTVLILQALDQHGPMRHRELVVRFPSCSVGALDRYLALATGNGLIRRERFNEVPPRVMYTLTDLGKAATDIVGAELKAFGTILVGEQAIRQARDTPGVAVDMTPHWEDPHQ